MSILGGQHETLYAAGREVLDDAIHQPGAQPPPSVLLIDEHVADPRERGPVGDHASEGRLLIPGVNGVRTRSGD